MSTAKGLRAGVVAAILIGMTFAAGGASAQAVFSTERPGSVLIFPKVVNTLNTVIQITNTTNSVIYAHCFYVDGRQVNGEARWQVTDFDLTLTRQQPTHWGVAEGRAVNPFDTLQTGDPGIDPGLVPPVSPGFEGFLVCVQTDPGGNPISGNALKGEATVGTISGLGGTNTVSKYNAIAIPGLIGNNGDNVLQLDGIEYAACPRDMVVNFPADGAPDPAISGAGNVPSEITSNLTLIPCGMDFENLIPASTTLTADIRNEFELPSSVTIIPVDCFFEAALDAPVFGNQLTLGGLGSSYGSAIIRPLGPTDLPGLGVLNSLHAAGDGTADTEAKNLYVGLVPNPTAPGFTIPTVNSEIRLPIFP